MKDNEVVMTVQRPHPVTVESLKNLLTSAFEGGSNYWIGYIVRNGADQTQAPFLCDVPFVPGAFLEVTEQESSEDDPVIHRLDLDVLKTGLQRFANVCPRQFNDWVSENDDALTADCFLQCCFFPDVKYG